MKTNYFSSAKSTSIYYLILGFSMVMVSCGSYKSSTYYDRDGIYGSDENESKNSNKNVDKYKEYFSSLRENKEQEQVFTDVENYSSVQDSVNNKSEKAITSYSGWGNNQQPVNITIYDMMGRLVKTLVDGSQTAGFKTVQWDATNDRNEPISAGLYLYTMQKGQHRETGKMVLIK